MSAADPVRLNRPLVLETLERVEDGAGGYSETWTTLGTLWAEVRARGGRESEGAAAPLSTVPYIITVRAAPFDAPSRPRAGQRFRSGARLFPILAVAEDDPGERYLTCFAQEEIVA